jgi:DNA-binding CsgD family transcriptional regulator
MSASMPKHSGQTDNDWDRIIGSIYDCALDPNLWHDLLASLARITHGHAAVLNSLDRVHHSGSVLVECNTDPSWSDKYRQFYSQINPTIDLVEKIPVFHPFTFNELFGWRTFAKSQYHSEYRDPQGFGDSLSIMMERGQQRTVSISIFRPRADPLYSKTDIATMRRLAPHIRRSVEFGRLLGNHRVEIDELHEVLNRLAFGVLLLDRDRRIVFSNATADAMMRGGAISADRERVVSCKAVEDAKWFASLFSTGAATDGHRVLQTQTGTPLMARATIFGAHTPLLPSASHLVAAHQAVCLLVLQPADAAPPADGVAFARLHGLTTAEHRVLLGLIEGQTVQQIADELRIALPTARTHLQRIFQKSGSRRQADLIRRAGATQTPLK